MKQIAWIGDFFLNALKMVVVPLIVFSIVSGISSLGNSSKLGSLSTKTIMYYFTTTGIAVCIGIVLVNIITPGYGMNIEGSAIPEVVSGKQNNSFLDIFKGLVSPNIIYAMSSKTPKIMPIILFSILLGFALSRLGEKAKPTVEFFDTVNSAIMKIVGIILWIAPIGIFALIANQVASAGGQSGIISILKGIAGYFFTVLLALGIHAMIILPAIYIIFKRKNPLSYIKNNITAYGTAFSTASSSATLPVTFDCCVSKNKVKKEVASFVLPLGATINMDGTALYEAIAAITIAQAYGIDLSISQQVIIFITANLAAIGAAGIPQAGLVTMVLVLQSVGLPLEGMSIILSLDWLLDRFRTTVNVIGDTIGSAIIDTDPINAKPSVPNQ